MDTYRINHKHTHRKDKVNKESRQQTHRKEKVNKENDRENLARLPFDYVIGGKVVIRKDGILRKAEIKYEGPYTITQVHCNGTLRIQRGSVSERLNIRRVIPYFE